MTNEEKIEKWTKLQTEIRRAAQSGSLQPEQISQ
jgi:hypothetical protein